MIKWTSSRNKLFTGQPFFCGCAEFSNTCSSIVPMFPTWWAQQKQWSKNPPTESSHYRSKNLLLWESASGGFVWFLKFPTNKRQAQSFNQRKAACPKTGGFPNLPHFPTEIIRLHRRIFDFSRVNIILTSLTCLLRASGLLFYLFVYGFFAAPAWAEARSTTPTGNNINNSMNKNETKTKNQNKRAAPNAACQHQQRLGGIEPRISWLCSCWGAFLVEAKILLSFS